MSSAYSVASAFNSFSSYAIPLVPETATPSADNQSDNDIREESKRLTQYTTRSGSLSSFLCHVFHLEKRLRDEEGMGGFIDENIEKVVGRASLGEGGQFKVYSAEATFKRPMRHLKANEPGQMVAIKVVKPRVENNAPNNWSNILLEVRSLMHEYLRYHPNIVRLLGFTWAPGWNSSVYPIVIMEYARWGTLESLQKSAPPFPFAGKQKLCHDVARGLSILHACGIIHGDLNHKNVLIFDNPYEQPPGEPYLAKLTDFGGAVMDIEHAPSQSLRMKVLQYPPPEASMELSAGGLKKMDTYAFGLLFWRTLMDGKDLLEVLGLTAGKREDEIMAQSLAQDDKKMRNRVLESIGDHLPPGTSRETLELIAFTINRTLRTDPEDRFLAAAQAALRNGHVRGVPEHLKEMADRNSTEKFKIDDGIRRETFDEDRIGFLLGKMGDFYDAQRNRPGYRTELSHPASAQFLFEPMKAKWLLSWEQQVDIVKELKAAAQAEDEITALGIPPFKAAFYLFQCYLTEFGVDFDAKELCHWLSLAAEPDDKWEDEIFAQAWLWRICDALGCSPPVSEEKLKVHFRSGVTCGFRESVTGWNSYIERLVDPSERRRHSRMLKDSKRLLKTYAGGVGMWHYFPSTIVKDYNLSDVHILDQQIKEGLGDEYEKHLLAQDQPTPTTEEEEFKSGFHKLYVSNVGHGLLHYAATFGKDDVLKHILDTYRCDVNRGSAFRYDSPLACAVRSAQYECVLLLLDRGAQPSKIEQGEEAPLHWLCGFEVGQEEQMSEVAKMFIVAGADIDELSTTRGDRGIAADWGSLFNISTTPLGRAVIARNHTAMRVLLGLGANPKFKGDEDGLSPVDIASLLFYTEELHILLEKVDKQSSLKLLDESWILEAAHKRKKDSIDPSCLQSRLIRLGSSHKSGILETFRLIREWNHEHPSTHDARQPNTTPDRLLYSEVLLGDADIVEALLELNYDPNGTMESRPLQAAAITKNWRIFEMLLRFGADPLQHYMHDSNMKLTFLHAIALAKQGAKTPDGVRIAERLLAAGVPVEVPLILCPVTPFALCVINNCFDVADILLAYGADLNPVCALPPGEQGPPCSLLGQLVMRPTERSLDAVQYFVNAGRRESLLKPLDGVTPIGIPSHNVSVLHQLAAMTHDAVEYHWPASGHIMHHVLTAFDEPEFINERCLIGTPLSIAIMNHNHEMVRRLLEKNVDTSTSTGLDLPSIAKSINVDREYTRDTPAFLSLLLYEGMLSKIDATVKANSTVNYIGPIEYALSTAEKVVRHLLPLDPDDEAVHLWVILWAWKDELITAIRRLLPNMSYISREDYGDPVDLSGLTEERPSDWVAGKTMDDETALRTLLHYFRKDPFEWPDSD
ncbi:hypothetical protein P154DRAFT_485712 [Amniculicola lignicola CBS 123094]|uniref:Protein kinase domain-containing protein n=1 Tax=Amniculicola lignicola CBS 123094 TaxID=1392246 RepID=A0A6A5WR80_9PLEO|nr:hypothetical protein P154DRAFT_485712 [Amniculicola lignicola CBS 123094]